jgi:hypothetical protein
MSFDSAILERDFLRLIHLISVVQLNGRQCAIVKLNRDCRNCFRVRKKSLDITSYSLLALIKSLGLKLD